MPCECDVPDPSVNWRLSPPFFRLHVQICTFSSALYCMYHRCCLGMQSFGWTKRCLIVCCQVSIYQNVVVSTNPLVLFKDGRHMRDVWVSTKGPLRVTTGSQSLLEVLLFPGVSLSVLLIFSVLSGAGFKPRPIYAQVDGENQTGGTGLCRWAFCTLQLQGSFCLEGRWHIWDGTVHQCQTVVM